MCETHFATNHDSSRGKLGLRVLLNAVVQSDNVEAVQKLAFVLMNTFHLKQYKLSITVVKEN